MDSIPQQILQETRAYQAALRRDIAARGLPPQTPHTNWEKYCDIVDMMDAMGTNSEQVFNCVCAFTDTVFHPPPDSPTNDSVRGFELLRMAQVTEDFIDEFLAHEGMKITDCHDLDYEPAT